MHIAIDGTAGSGKSTVAKLVATRLGLGYIDSGATYRLVALKVLEAGVDTSDAQACSVIAADVASRCTAAPDGHLFFDGRPVGAEIRTGDVSTAASLVAVHPGVRKELVNLQRHLAPTHGAVIEGRDIGTVVWPTAELKVFLDAHPEVRAARRGGATGEAAATLAARDERDTSRSVSPLTAAAGALVIDTSAGTPDEIASSIIAATRRGVDPGPWYRFVRVFLSVLLHVFYRLRTSGTENIPTSGPAIIAANHRSLVDIAMVSSLTQRKIWFMAKEELFEHKAGVMFFGGLGAYPVKRGHPDRAALTKTFDLLSRGEIVGLFPEGTRHHEARFNEIEDGLAYLALKSGAPVVPVALSGTGRIKPPGSRFPRLLKLRARVGPAFVLNSPPGAMVTRARIREASNEALNHLRAVMNSLEPS